MPEKEVGIDLSGSLLDVLRQAEKKGLDAVAFDEPANNSPVVHENLRGAAYYSN